MQGTLPAEMKSFEVLESRIHQAVDLVRKLREENSILREKMSALEGSAADAAIRSKELDAARLTSQQLQRELDSLREEKQSVVSRVDSMLKDLERLSLD
jgi:FtsZ-binding cell division protein ZapB